MPGWLLAVALAVAGPRGNPGAPSTGMAVEAGVQVGAQLVENPRLYDTPAGVSVGFWSAPRVTVWGAPRAGIEVAVGVTAGRAAQLQTGFLSVAPTVSAVWDPRGEGRMGPRPLLRLGIGADGRRLVQPAFADVPERQWRASLLAVGGLSALMPVRGALRVRVDLDGQLAFRPVPAEGWRPVAGVALSVGVSTRFRAARDADRDRIVDREDACPDQPEDVDGFRDRDGCPERDNDQDGVRDELDACDDQPEDRDGDVDEDGCPE